MIRLELSDVLELGEGGSLMALGDSDGVLLVQEVPQVPERTWRKLLPKPSKPFAELRPLAPKSRWQQGPQVVFCRLPDLRILVVRAYFVNHYETGELYRLDLLSSEGRSILDQEEFFDHVSSGDGILRLELFLVDTRILWRMFDQGGNMVRERTLG